MPRHARALRWLNRTAFSIARHAHSSPKPEGSELSAAAVGMSDDDWDADDFDVDAAIAAKEAEKRKADKSDDEDSEEDRRKEEEERKARQAAVPKPKPKPKPEKVEYDVPLADKQAEKLRRRKLEEEADARLAADLFSGLADDSSDKKATSSAKQEEDKDKKPKLKIVVNDAFDKVELKTQADVDSVIGTCLEKLNKSKAKGAGQKFLTDLFKAIEGQLETKDMDAFEKALAAIMKAKKVEKTTSTAEKRKTNEKLDKHTKFNTHDEVSVVYGGGDWDEWDEEWDEWQE